MPRRSNGKGILVDTLYYRYDGVIVDEATPDDDESGAQGGRVASKEVPVQVRLCKAFDDRVRGTNRPVKSCEFRLECSEPEFKIHGTDIEALRLAAWDFLNDAFKVRWEDYFLVNIERGFVYHGRGNALRFVYDEVQRGVAHDGTLLLREFRHSEFVISPWPGEFRDQRKQLMACIPATEANRAALEQFSEMIDQLRERLAEFFRPDQIMETLANLGGLEMLGASPSD